MTAQISTFNVKENAQERVRASIAVLVCDDADELRKTYSQGLRMMGYEVFQASSGAQALELIRTENIDAALLDLHMPGMDGLTCLRTLKGERPEIEVVIMTGYGTIPSAVEAMRLGAYDYITKPFSLAELDQRLKRAMQSRDLRRENVHLRGLLREKYHCQNLIGKSEAMQRVFRVIRQVAQSRATILLQGESGTGKELVARAIHFNSPLAAGPMVTVDCGAIAPTVIESELFGHVKGAFTGAHQSKEGLFRLARGGTIFFDEIGELPLEMQTKLLRALQEREIRPVGSDKSYPVDVRVIAATHRNLDQAVKDGQFRQDLYYRLNVITVELPALAAHKEDIPLLLAHFLSKHSRPERTIERVHGQAIHAMMQYTWPGNIRELENVVERALALGSGSTVMPADLPAHLAVLASFSESGQAAVSTTENSHRGSDLELTSASSNIGTVDDAPLVPPSQPDEGEQSAQGAQSTLDEIERQAILGTLRSTGGDRTACARILGIDKSTLYRKLKRYNVVFSPDESSHAETA